MIIISLGAAPLIFWQRSAFCVVLVYMAKGRAAMPLHYLGRIMERWRDYPLRPGSLLAGAYRIRALRGEGSYGLTYACEETKTGRIVVVKLARPSKGALGRELLAREIGLLSGLRHPDIPRCLGSFEHRGRLAMVSEYAAGRTVEELIFDRGRAFEQREALQLIRRLMEPVGYIHAQGIVHLDIRIPNVILQGDDVRLIDFGLAARIGEPPRLEPEADEEMRLRRTTHPRSDLYAIGHLLLYMLYSAFQPGEGEEAERGWEEELPLTNAVRRMLRRLLQLDAPYDDAPSFVAALDAALREA